MERLIDRFSFEMYQWVLLTAVLLIVVLFFSLLTEGLFWGYLVRGSALLMVADGFWTIWVVDIGLGRRVALLSAILMELRVCLLRDALGLLGGAKE